MLFFRKLVSVVAICAAALSNKKNCNTNPGASMTRVRIVVTLFTLLCLADSASAQAPKSKVLSAAQAPPKVGMLLTGSPSVGPGQELYGGKITSHTEFPAEDTHLVMQLTSGAFVKLVAYGTFPFKATDIVGTHRTVVVTRDTNPSYEHTVIQMVHVPASAQLTALEPVMMLQPDEIAVEGTISARLRGPDGTLIGIVAQLKDGTQATINMKTLIGEDEKDFVFVIRKSPNPFGERTVIGMLRPIKR